MGRGDLISPAGLTLGRPPLKTTPPPLAPAVNLNAVTLPAPDMDRARADALATLAAIDWSKDVVVIWAPGTNRRGIPDTLQAAAAATAAWSGDLSLVELRYPASYDMRQGSSTGAATIRLVLEAIDARSRKDGRKRKVHLAGESQGSWAILEAISHPADRARVERIGVTGVPYGASRHHLVGGDPRVIEITRITDPVARPIAGDPNAAVAAAEQVQSGKFTWGGIRSLFTSARANPMSAALLVLSAIRIQLPGGPDRDPHNYEDVLPAVVRFLAVP